MVWGQIYLQGIRLFSPAKPHTPPSPAPGSLPLPAALPPPPDSDTSHTTLGKPLLISASFLSPAR